MTRIFHRMRIPTDMGDDVRGNGLVVVLIAGRDNNTSNNHGFPIYEYVTVFGKIKGVLEQELRHHGRFSPSK